MLIQKKIAFFLTFFCGTILVNAQNIPDSLKNKTYKALGESFFGVQNDPIMAALYANTYLLKAKKEKDTLNTARGYHYLYVLHKRIGYLDSIITITTNKNYKNYPIGGYYLKGQKLYTQRSFEKSLNNFLKVRKLNNQQFNDEELDVQLDYYIGLIKSRIGDFDDALRLFFDNKSYYSAKGNNSKILSSLYAIADTYRLKKVLDSSSYYNTLGIKKSLIDKNEKQYNYFLLNQGATLHDKKLYQSSLDSLNKCLPKIIATGDKPNIAMAYYFLGSNFYALKNKTKAILFFKKVDSLFNKTNDIHPELRRGYELLIMESKLKNDSKKELLHIKKLLEVDKILNKNYKALSKKLVHEYDTPILLSKKEELIKNIKKENSRYAYLVIIILIVLTILILYFIFYVKRQKIYKQKLEALLKKQTEITQPINNFVTDSKNKNKDLPISKEKIAHILNALDGFEKNKDYLDSTITVNSLAKKMQTNGKYLSRVVNHYKKKNFTNFLNDLRIEYAINKLTNDLQFRKYTIQGIANEVGFNNAESFSKAFFKKTGIKPSYFIKNIP